MSMAKPGKSQVEQQFEEEALLHVDLLHNYALRMTNSREDAADLVQEVFLKAWRFWGSYERGTNIKAWLFQILRNSYINRYRQRSRNPEMVAFDSVQNLDHTNGHRPGKFSDMGVGNLLEDDVAHAVAALPDEFRTVVILSDIEGLTYEEIAEFTASPIGTVRSRLHRGRKILRAQLLKHAQEKGYTT